MKAKVNTEIETKKRPFKYYVNKLPKFGVYIFLILVSIIMLLPFLWMFFSSFKPISEIFTYPPQIIGKTFTLNNYITLFKEHAFAQAFFNSSYIAVLSTAGSVFFCALGGYAFAKFEFKGKAILFVIVLGSMMIPGEVTMVPLYIVFKKLGWINSHIGLIVPGLANAFGIFFMRQYMSGLSNEIIESGRIDGCSEFGIFTKLILPIVKPAVGSLGIIFFMNSWNNFLWPLIILKSQSKLTLAVALQSLQQGIRTPYDLIMAGSVVSVVPLIIIFLLFQNQFIAGMTAGAVKE